MSASTVPNVAPKTYRSHVELEKDSLLKSLGYDGPTERLPEYTTRLLVGSEAEPIPAPVLPEGFTTRPVAGEEEGDALGEVHSASFGSTWNPGEYLRVMRTPGYRADRELVAVAPDGRLAAFLIYWPDEVSKSGLFEPVGCHKDFRRLGLARALFYEGMRRLKAEGIATAVVEPLVEAENPAASALYRSVGFRTSHGWVRYRKKLS